MNLESVTTPADLVALNNEPADATQTAIDALSHVGFEDTVNIVKWLVTNLRDFHHEQAEQRIEEKADNIAAWVADTEKLQIALELINQVEVN